MTPWYGTRGPPTAPIVLVGEAWGEAEAREERPFVGLAGTELSRILAAAGVSEADILFANVVPHRPYSNEMWRLFVPKVQKPPRIAGLAPNALVQKGLHDLYEQISAHPRKLVIATGNYALWALSEVTGSDIAYLSNKRPIPPELQTWVPNGITSWRGSMLFCSPHSAFGTLPANLPLLPIIHPAAILRDWSNWALTVHDLKSRVPMAMATNWRPVISPEVRVAPGFQYTITTLRNWREQAASGTTVRLAVDIETARSFITCLGLADSPQYAISIPFIRRTDDGGFTPHWEPDEEVEVIRRLRRLFVQPGVLIYGQNFIYDTQYLQHWFGVTPHLHHDTMLAQNVLFPGTPKDLGHLSSLYCTYHWYWKEDAKEWNLKGDLGTLLRYNAEDCLRTIEIGLAQEDVIRQLGQEQQMQFKMRTNDLCLRMMNRGVRIDQSRRGSMLFELNAALNGLYSELLDIVPQAMVKPDADKPWYRSSKQTQFLLYDQLAMRIVKHRKTGKPTIGKEALMQLEKWYPEFTGLFRRLDLAGSVDNTVGVLRSPLDPDGRMRCSFNPGGTETHRLSSSTNAFGRGTNLQNLTKGEEDD